MDTIEQLRARANDFISLPENRRGGVNQLAETLEMSRQWVSAFLAGGPCSDESQEKMQRALDVLHPHGRKMPTSSSGARPVLDPIALAVRELRLLADILEAPEVSKEVKAQRYETFINSAYKGLRLYAERGKKVSG